MDHTQAPKPSPAQPLLASDLILLEQKQRERFCGNGRPERIKTGCMEVDGLLSPGLGDGGLERGIVLGISAGDEGRLISLNLLATILVSHLSHPYESAHPIATIIDTTSSFPLSLLARILKSRLVSSSLSTDAIRATEVHNQKANEAGNHAIRKAGDKEIQLSAEEEKLIDEQANRCLEMVALSRVFDVEGLWEVLGELDVFAREASDVMTEQSRRETGVTRSQIREDPDESETKAKETRREERLEIEDSEDDEDLLLTLPSPNKSVERSPLETHAEIDLEAKFPKNEDSSGKQHRPKTEEAHATQMIIVDNMTHLISDLFGRKEKSDAHQLLGLLARHIHTLSSTKNILTILHNTTIPSKPTHNPSYPTAKHPKPTPHPSIFPSAPSKPSLGQLFAAFPSLHLLISQLPKRREDAEALYAQDADHPAPAAGSVQYCYVLEGLKDETPKCGKDGAGRSGRFGAREQAWTALEINDEGTGMRGVFKSQGDVRREHLGRIKEGLASVGGVRDVGRMAKMQGGFGGRRV